MRHDLNNFAKKEGVVAFLPGYNGIPPDTKLLETLRTCEKFSMKNETMKTCLMNILDKTDRLKFQRWLQILSCSSVIGMHIGPFEFSNLIKHVQNLSAEGFFADSVPVCSDIKFERRKCIVIFRDPIERLISHYYHFVYPTNNISLKESLSQDSEKTFKQTGGESYMKVLSSDTVQHSVSDILSTLRDCDIGTFEKRNTFINVLNNKYLGLNLSAGTKKQVHTSAERSEDDRRMAELYLSKAFPNDNVLYKYASFVEET